MSRIRRAIRPETGDKRTLPGSGGASLTGGMNIIEGFQDLVAQVPEWLQPVIVALAGAVPFVEGEGAATIGILGGIPPIVAVIAAILGNFACVAALVLLGAGARKAVVTRS